MHMVCKERACTFQTAKDCGSTTVGWTISLAGKTPQVTAFTSVGPKFEIMSPLAFTAMYVMLGAAFSLGSRARKFSGDVKSSTYAF